MTETVIKSLTFASAGWYVCVPAEVICQFQLPCDGIRRWEVWEVISHKGGVFTSGIPALILVRETPRELAPPLSAMWGHRERVAICNLYEGPHQN